MILMKKVILLYKNNFIYNKYMEKSILVEIKKGRPTLNKNINKEKKIKKEVVVKPKYELTHGEDKYYFNNMKEISDFTKLNTDQVSNITRKLYKKELPITITKLYNKK